MDYSPLDSDNDNSKPGVWRFDWGTYLLVLSFAVEIYLMFAGFYWHTCSTNALDLTIILMVMGIPLLSYQFYRQRMRRWKWLVVGVGMSVNLTLGVLLYNTVCCF